MATRERTHALARLGDSGRAFVTTLAHDAAAGIRSGLVESGKGTGSEDPGFRAERFVSGAVGALADTKVRANLEQTSELVGESIGRGIARGVSVGFSPAARKTAIAAAIGLGVLALLWVARRP